MTSTRSQWICLGFYHGHRCAHLGVCADEGGQEPEALAHGVVRRGNYDGHFAKFRADLQSAPLYGHQEKVVRERLIPLSTKKAATMSRTGA